MLKDDGRIQLDLFYNFTIERITHGKGDLKYTRDLNTVLIDFPQTLKAGRTYSIDVHYSGSPLELGRFDALAFKKDPTGAHWINTANEGVGSAVWWPGKDSWRDEPEGMDIRVAVPNGLVNVSNGRFIEKTDLGDGYTRWHYRVHYPINSYNVSLNIGNYVHFGEKMGDLTLDYYVLPASLEKAKRQFAQARPMLEAFEKYFGEYPFKKDGFKLIEVPYSGMEHQSAVTYGNRFANGYLERDWTGVGISLKFDFIIIHESAHEWFGNAVSAGDQADMWIHEALGHLPGVPLRRAHVRPRRLPEVHQRLQDRRSATRNRSSLSEASRAIRTRTCISRARCSSTRFAAGIRRNDDAGEAWFKLQRDLYDQFKYKNNFTEEIVAFVNKQLGRGSDAGVRSVSSPRGLPVLELTFNEAGEGRLLPVERRRARIRDADPGWRSGEVADGPPDAPTGSRCHGRRARKHSRSRPICTTCVSRSSMPPGIRSRRETDRWIVVASKRI